MHLLIIENDTLLNSILTNRLQEYGYRVDSCQNLLDGIAYTKSGEFDCIIADTTLPINTSLLLQTLNLRFCSTAVLLLTAHHAQEQRPQYNNHLGVIEYLSKPFSLSKLISKIELLLYKNQTQNHTLITLDDLIMNTQNHTVTRNQKLILLSEKEYTLLHYLLEHIGETLHREQISSAVWNLNIKDSSNIVDVYIRYLRNKIDKGFDTKLIHTVRGIGYVMEVK